MNLLYIDLFCGAGGTSTGVNSARIDDRQCAKVIACVNHDRNAIASHLANHPDAMHFTEDIRTLELSPLVNHVHQCRKSFPCAKIVLWASLECTNFSKAKGGMPRDADSRTLAEHLFRYIEALDPDYIQIENVEEFMSWGEVDENGKPISMDKGKSYLRWVRNVKSYGYRFDHRILNAANYGAYTTRKRFFGIFAKKGLPIVFPEPTNCKGGADSLFSDLEPWKPVREVLDFEDEGDSVFGRRKPLVESSLERIYAGLIKFVAGGRREFAVRCSSSVRENVPGDVNAFLAKYFSGDPEGKCVSVDEPAGTITTIDHHAMISLDYAPATTSFIANEYSGGGRLSSLSDPNPAVLTNPKQKLVTCRRWVMNTNFSNVGSSVDEPAQTITANRKWHYLMNPQFNSAGGSVDKPCFTLIARMDKMPPYLIEVSREKNGDLPDFIIPTAEGLVYVIGEDDSEIMRMIKEFMAMYAIVDIKMRMLRIMELKKIMGFPEDYILIGTQAEQKKFIGNAVEVTIARRWCESLCAKLNECMKMSA